MSEGENIINVTFLVGNGFDLSVGLKTSYTSFYEWYCKTNSKSEIISEFKENIRQDIETNGENWSDFEMGLAQHTALCKDSNDFIECYEDARNELMIYLEKENSRFNQLKIDSTLLPGFYGGLVNFLCTLSPMEKQSIEKKLKTKQESIYFNFINFNYTNALDRCVNLTTRGNIGSLNFSGICAICYIKREIIHIHGTIDNFPIIGVSESKDIKNHDFRETEEIQTLLLKSKSITSIGQFWYNEAEQLIENSRIICIFGMSLGRTDSHWWQNIAKWLTFDTNNELLIFWYDKDYLNNRSTYRYNHIINSVRNKFISYTNFSKDEIDNVVNRIHVVINTTSVLTTKIRGIISDNTI